MIPESLTEGLNAVDAPAPLSITSFYQLLRLPPARRLTASFEIEFDDLRERLFDPNFWSEDNVWDQWEKYSGRSSL